MRIVHITTDNRDFYGDYDTPVPHFGAAPEALFQGFQALTDFEFHVISCLRRPAPAPASIAPRLYYHQCVVPRLGWRPSLYSGCLLAIRRIVRDIKPDLVHGQGTEQDCALAAVYSGIKNVVTIHGNMAEIHRLGFAGSPLYGHLAARLETHALGKTRGVFCNSGYTENLVAPRAHKTWRVSNAIRLSFFDQPPAPRRNREKPQLLTVGVISPRKQPLELLRAAEALHRQGASFRLVFIGVVPSGSDYARAFTAEMLRAEKKGYAHCTGFLKPEELIALMDASDGFVHFPKEEAFGLVVAEALARGLKFFGANTGGIPDIAKGISGVELYDRIEDLSGGISRWLQADAPRPDTAAREVRERYHPNVIAGMHKTIYETL